MIKKDEQEKKPLDMTTEEAMEFLFPPEVVEELKHVANPVKKTPEPSNDNGSGESDSAYKNHS